MQQQQDKAMKIKKSQLRKLIHEITTSIENTELPLDIIDGDSGEIYAQWDDPDNWNDEPFSGMEADFEIWLSKNSSDYTRHPDSESLAQEHGNHAWYVRNKHTDLRSDHSTPPSPLVGKYNLPAGGWGIPEPSRGTTREGITKIKKTGLKKIIRKMISEPGQLKEQDFAPKVPSKKFLPSEPYDDDGSESEYERGYSDGYDNHPSTDNASTDYDIGYEEGQRQSVSDRERAHTQSEGSKIKIKKSHLRRIIREAQWGNFTGGAAPLDEPMRDSGPIPKAQLRKLADLYVWHMGMDPDEVLQKPEFIEAGITDLSQLEEGT
jgi:hypothetical protein